LNENNTKKFIEERKRQAVMQSRQMELLRKLHTDHADKLRLEMNSVCSQIFLGGKLGPQQERPSGASAVQDKKLSYRRGTARCNCAETTYTTSPDQIDGMKLEI